MPTDKENPAPREGGNGNLGELLIQARRQLMTIETEMSHAPCDKATFETLAEKFLPLITNPTDKGRAGTLFALLGETDREGERREEIAEELIAIAQRAISNLDHMVGVISEIAQHVGVASPAVLPTLEVTTRNYLEEIIRETHGNVAKAAVIAGVPRSTLYNLLREHRIDFEALREPKKKK